MKIVGCDLHTRYKEGGPGLLHALILARNSAPFIDLLYLYT